MRQKATMSLCPILRKLSVGGILFAVALPTLESSMSEPDVSAEIYQPETVLDAERFPDAAWAEKLKAGDSAGAIRVFVEELRKGASRIEPRESIPSIRKRWFGVGINEVGGMNLDADAVVDLRYGGAYGIEHQFEDEIDWHYDASEGRTNEWTWQLNRHLHWINLADAYRETGDAKYAEAWERELRSWLAQCRRPEDSGNYAGSPWRTLDTGIRAGSSWPYAFEVFRQSPHVTDEALWLLVCAQREQALHLMASTTGGNWKIMESNGLGHAGMMFPELRGAREFAETAIERVQEEIDRQFYPDGTHQEFAPHYAAAGCIANFYALARIAEKNDFTLPESFWDDLVLMTSALGRIADPEGVAPGVHNSPPIDIVDLYRDLAASTGHSTLKERPWLSEEPDLVPWGGYAVLRRADRYAIFDAGPRGTSHFHDDDLQFFSYAYGRHFAIDPASPQYTNEPISRHLRSSAAHNVVLMDGKLHAPAEEIRRPQEPMPITFVNAGDVVAAGAKRELRLVDQAGTTFHHERIVLDIEGLGWLILDRMTPPANQEHSWEWLWNLDVDSVSLNDDSAVASHEGGPELFIQAAGDRPFSLKVSQGEKEPEIRGWLARGQERTYTPIPCLRIISEPAAGEVALFTLKVPSPAGETAGISIQTTEFRDGEWNVVLGGPEQPAYRIHFSGGNRVEHAEVFRGEERVAAISMDAH